MRCVIDASLLELIKKLINAEFGSFYSSLPVLTTQPLSERNLKIAALHTLAHYSSVRASIT